MNEIKTFTSDEFGTIRTTADESGEPWFVARDVCSALGLSNTTEALRSLEADEISNISNSEVAQNGGRSPRIVSEAGFYSLVMKSRKPEARAFKRWVTHEVLPAIRRQGGYMVAREDEAPDQVMARALLIAKDALDRKDRELAELRPKALFADAVGSSDGTCLVGEFAKMLKQNGVDIGQNRLFDWLRDKGYLGKAGGNRNVPTQRAMEIGLFRIKESTIVHGDGHVTISRTPKITGKGQLYFLDKFLPERPEP